MTESTWTRLADLIPDALELAPDERAAFLDRACTNENRQLDTDLRREAARLIAASEAADTTGALISPVAGLRSWDDDVLPDQIGPWRVTGLLGEGGAGVVYSAERADGRIDRTVALKVLRRVGRAVIRQFDRERRALALLEHPHIARLYDAGVVQDGPYRNTPFLVMEFVDGLAITDAADHHQLDVEARIQLILHVCAAVGYAHGRLVLHRDLKPSNVLVTETDDGPRAVVLDFGVARLLGDEDEALTQTNGRAYTPAYAAPEQLNGSSITTATDVYGIGALLYELLAGTRAHASSTDGVGRTSLAPTPPSAVAPAEISRQLAGDLDTICLKALDPDPARRYASADALANDLNRHLEGLPIEARPATIRYRAGRFVQRNRAAVAATALIALAILGGLGAALWQRAEAQRERDRAQIAAVEAEAQAERAEAVAGFLEQILRAPNTRWYNEGTATGPDTPIRAVLDEAAVRVDQDFADQPDLLADLHHILGDTYGALNLPDEALRHHRRTLALRESIYDAPHPKIAEALYYVASRRDSLLLSLDYMERALAMLRVRNEGNNFPFIAHDLAGRYQVLGRPLDAVSVTTEGIDYAEERFVPDTDGHRYRDTILAMLFRARATALLDLGRVDEAALELARDDSLMALVPPTSGHYFTWRSHTCQTGRLRRLQARQAEAESALLACLGDTSPLAQVSPFPIPDSGLPDTPGFERVGTIQLVALYDAMGRTPEANRYRLRAEVAQAYVDSLLAVGRRSGRVGD
ncbi:MAG: hypothetical protein Rubg2KO_07090 [Rubricoccaceae bacterium]